jgi:hypothetical protein
MKKIFLVIAFVAMGLTLVPQVHAQDQKKMEQLMNELEQIGKRVESERRQPTAQELQRIQQIRQELAAAAGYGGITVPQQSQSLSPQQMRQAEQMQRQQQQQMQEFQQMQQPRQAQTESFPSGANAGWPSASTFGTYGLPALRQPAGTTASYGYGSGNKPNDRMIVYIKGGGQKSIDDLAAALDSGLKHKGEKAAGNYWNWIPLPAAFKNSGWDSYAVEIELLDGGVKLTVFGRAG